MKLAPSKCQPGDILLFYGLNAVTLGEKAVKGLKVMTVLPAVISAAQGGTNALIGSASCKHAAIISRVIADGPVPSVWISHATGAKDGAISTDQFSGCDGVVQVFRLNVLGDVPPEAAGVARTWAPSAGSNMRYSIPKAFGCAFRSSSFGSGAKKRAAFYRAHKNTRGGPPGEDGGTFKSMFCSMFVIACYQAVMDDARTDGVLALDAKNTSPMYLDGYLRNSSHWSTVNAIQD